MNRFFEFSRSIFRKKYLACVETENKWFMLRVRCAKRVPTNPLGVLCDRIMFDDSDIRSESHSILAAACIALALNSFCFAHIFWQPIQRTRIGHVLTRSHASNSIVFRTLLFFRWFLVHNYKQHWPLLHDCHNNCVFRISFWPMPVRILNWSEQMHIIKLQNELLCLRSRGMNGLLSFSNRISCTQLRIEWWTFPDRYRQRHDTLSGCSARENRMNQ